VGDDFAGWITHGDEHIVLAAHHHPFNDSLPPIMKIVVFSHDFLSSELHLQEHFECGCGLGFGHLNGFLALAQRHAVRD